MEGNGSVMTERGRTSLALSVTVLMIDLHCVPNILHRRPAFLTSLRVSKTDPAPDHSERKRMVKNSAEPQVAEATAVFDG